MYNYFQSPPQQPFQNRNYPILPTLKGYQVSCIDEVKSATIDFDGTVFYFPDQANQCIYSKYIDPHTGMAQLNMYKLTELPSSNNIDSGNFITRSEFDKSITELSSTVNQLQQLIQNNQMPAPSVNYKEAF